MGLVKPKARPAAPDDFLIHIDPDLAPIVPNFLKNRRKDVQILKTSIKKGHLDMIRTLGHRMKGDGSGYGFDAISRIGQDLEEAALKGELSSIRRHTAELEHFLAHVHPVYQKKP